MRADTTVKHTGALVLTALILSFGADSGNAQVRSGAAFLKIMPGSRVQGLAYNTTALLDEQNAFWGNPAATGLAREWQWSFTYTRWIAGIYNLSANYGRWVRAPWGWRNHIALGLNYLGVKEFDSSGGAAAPASASDMLAVLGIGSPVSLISDNLSVGANLKYMRSQLQGYHAGSFILDLGALYRTKRFRLSRSDSSLLRYGILSFGVSVSNLGKPLNFDVESTPLPRMFRAGVAFYAGKHEGLQFQISTDYRAIRDETATVGVGAEVSWRRRLAIRGGYNFNDRYLSKFSLGFGLRLDDVQSRLHSTVTGRNNGLCLDMVGLQNNDFFANAYRVTVGYIPLEPEVVGFLAEPDAVYAPTDTVTLVWRATRDPDLFDDTYYGYVVTRDRDELARFIRAVEDSSDRFRAGLPGAVAFGTNVVPVVLKGNPKLEECSVVLGTLPPGDYYWTAWAYDRDNHVRFASQLGEKIRHFRVVQPPVVKPAAPPDTTADLVLQKSVGTNPIRLDINFEFNSARLNQKARELLYMLGSALLSDELKDYHVELGGHTDTRGSEEYNLKLSQRRVDAAKRFLVRVMGIDSSRITAVGYGESRPLIPNAQTEAAHAINRRVELKFSKMGTDSLKQLPIVLAGDKFTFTITVVNLDTARARHLQIRDSMPDTLRPAGFSLEPDSLTSREIVWSADSLAGKGTLRIDFNVQAPRFVEWNPFKAVNRAIVTAWNDTNLTNNADSASVYVIGMPDTIVYFGFDSTSIRKQEQHVLVVWARYLQRMPKIPLLIEGHTDSKGSASYNLRLSRRRAKAARDFIIKWLVEHTNVSPEELDIKIVGYGESRPIATNETEEGRQKNRRVVIRIRPED
ncbi:MAG: PorV/PorQ family protein [Calditrichaeota bacterium]|nr:PorV/PorQ family protein [Calditrichota bacterium]